jgi:uncharacterized membrane protein
VTITGSRARLLVGALILSVCLNLFGAAVYGARYFWRPDRGGPEAGFTRLIERAPEAAQPALQASFVAHQQALGERVAEARAAREAVQALLRTGEDDPAALESAFAEMRARWSAVQAQMHAIILQALPEMPPEGRTAWAERWPVR